MGLSLPLDIDRVRGFLSEAEGEALHAAVMDTPGTSPVVEIGSYCGKSTIYLGLACQATQRTLFAVDHHCGSEEHQPGEMFHDPDLVDDEGQVDTLREFRRNIRSAGLEDTVIPILAPSARYAQSWNGPVGLVFIDGGHSLDAALADYRGWAGFVESGGHLAIHDVYTTSESGGQAPITIYRMALASGLFREVAAVGSLRVLERR